MGLGEMFYDGCLVDSKAELDGSNFFDPTQPNSQVKWPNPSRPRINMKL